MCLLTSFNEPGTLRNL